MPRLGWQDRHALAQWIPGGRENKDNDLRRPPWRSRSSRTRPRSRRFSDGDVGEICDLETLASLRADVPDHRLLGLQGQQRIDDWSSAYMVTRTKRSIVADRTSSPARTMSSSCGSAPAAGADRRLEDERADDDRLVRRSSSRFLSSVSRAWRSGRSCWRIDPEPRPSRRDACGAPRTRVHTRNRDRARLSAAEVDVLEEHEVVDPSNPPARRRPTPANMPRPVPKSTCRRPGPRRGLAGAWFVAQSGTRSAPASTKSIRLFHPSRGPSTRPLRSSIIIEPATAEGDPALVRRRRCLKARTDPPRVLSAEFRRSENPGSSPRR